MTKPVIPSSMMNSEAPSSRESMDSQNSEEFLNTDQATRDLYARFQRISLEPFAEKMREQGKSPSFIEAAIHAEHTKRKEMLREYQESNFELQNTISMTMSPLLAALEPEQYLQFHRSQAGLTIAKCDAQAEAYALIQKLLKRSIEAFDGTSYQGVQTFLDLAEMVNRLVQT